MLSKNAIKPRGFHDWIWQYQQFLGLCSNFFEHLFWKKGEVYINNANWQFVLRPLSVMQYTFKNSTLCGINNTTLCGINRRTMWREFQIWRVFRKWAWLFRTALRAISVNCNFKLLLLCRNIFLCLTDSYWKFIWAAKPVFYIIVRSFYLICKITGTNLSQFCNFCSSVSYLRNQEWKLYCCK